MSKKKAKELREKSRKCVSAGVDARAVAKSFRAESDEVRDLIRRVDELIPASAGIKLSTALYNATEAMDNYSKEFKKYALAYRELASEERKS